MAPTWNSRTNAIFLVWKCKATYLRARGKSSRNLNRTLKFWVGTLVFILSLAQNTWDILQQWKNEYGRVFGYYIGLRPALNIVDADIVKEIFVRQFSNFVNRPVSFRLQLVNQRIELNWVSPRTLYNTRRTWHGSATTNGKKCAGSWTRFLR